jgi:hypothetical protein
VYRHVWWELQSSHPEDDEAGDAKVVQTENESYHRRSKVSNHSLLLFFVLSAFFVSAAAHNTKKEVFFFLLQQPRAHSIMYTSYRLMLWAGSIAICCIVCLFCTPERELALPQT